MHRLHDKADISSIGLEMGGCVIVGYLIGSWLDGAYGLAPWGTIAFVLFGFGAAIKGLIRVGRKAQRVSRTTSAPSAHPLPRRPFREVQRSW